MKKRVKSFCEIFFIILYLNVLNTYDIFMGNVDYLGKGIAVTTIQTFLSDHFVDVTEILIDPEKSNTRAIHVYQKAGFNIVGEFIASWYPVPHYLMHLSNVPRLSPDHLHQKNVRFSGQDDEVYAA